MNVSKHRSVFNTRTRLNPESQFFLLCALVDKTGKKGMGSEIRHWYPFLSPLPAPLASKLYLVSRNWVSNMDPEYCNCVHSVRCLLLFVQHGGNYMYHLF